ncbi:MAG TPA: hypothetical protein VMG32_04330 [Anaeromyxobacteraceae bacterium]|nr:hypothetical protein [Anaeromyxobacteraceae bacterium]
MKALRLLVPIVIVGVVLLIAIAQIARRSEAEAIRLARVELRREMLERATVARGAPGPSGAEEARAALRWWFEAVDGLKMRFPRAALEGSALKVVAGKGGEGEAEAWRAYAMERLAALRAGYTPLLSAVEEGLRLDVLSVSPGENPETHERGLRIDFALWGAPRRLERDASGAAAAAHPTLRVVVPVAFRQLAFRFTSEAGKAYGEMTGNGEPYRLLADPERFSAELPTGVALGTWWVEPFPREAARVEMAVGLQVQGMTSAALAPSFRWELPVPDAWKLREGEVFRAETREAPQEPAPPR